MLLPTFMLSGALAGASLLAAPASTIQSSSPPQPQAPMRDIPSEMRDGTRLLGDLWKPVGREAPFPVLLIRTPYGRHLEEGVGRRWSERGYGVFIQAVRGRDGSEGTWIPWENELEDGYDTIDWLSRQTWCNGRIGMKGGSYLGHTQILAAAAGHPSLTCVVPLSPGSDGFSDLPFSGGILKIGMIGWLYVCRDPVLDTSGDYPPTARDESLEPLPLSVIDEAWTGSRSDIWQRWVRVETLKDMPGLTVWDRAAQAERQVPAFHIDGVWDHESMATRRNWERFRALGNPDQYLIFGPWPHEPNQTRRPADVDYGPDAIVDLDDMIRRWYAHWLDGEPELGLPRVQVFATGANRWLHLEDWPAKGAEPKTLHVTSLEGAPGLAAQAPDEAVEWGWRYDPADLPPVGRDLSFRRTTKLWFDATDPDALVLTTAPFDQDTLLTGPVEIELAIESSAVDTDIFALLVEVRKDGQVRAIQNPSPLRMRFREGFDRTVPLEADEVTTATWALGNFAHVFAEGSRLGLALRSEWFPLFARNLGTLEPMVSATRSVPQSNLIHSGPNQVSALRLFQVPLTRLRPQGK